MMKMRFVLTKYCVNNLEYVLCGTLKESENIYLSISHPEESESEVSDSHLHSVQVSLLKHVH